MKRHVEICYGPPGTGKTTYCLDKLNEALGRGVAPEAVALLTFSRAAAQEAQQRLGVRNLRYVRTIHSLAYARLGLTRNRVMSKFHWLELAERIGVTFSGIDLDDVDRVPPAWAKGAGDKCLRIVGLAAASGRSLREVWFSENYDNLEYDTVETFKTELDRFKARHGLTDFTDMLDQAVEPFEDVELLVVDEAQDLTPQQWRFVRRLAAKVPHIVLAGDDDQAIYGWAGADPLGMLRFHGDIRVLPQSHRLPQAGHRLAQDIVSGITVRQAKEWRGRPDPGYVGSVIDLGEVDLHDSDWLLLARHRYQLKELEKEARRQGVPYQTSDGRSSLNDDCVRAVVTYERLRAGQEVTNSQVRQLMPFLGRKAPEVNRQSWSWDELDLWTDRRPWLDGLPHLSLEDREYIRSLRRRGYGLKDTPRVRLQTVHGAKGWEAKSVLLVTDVARTTKIGSDDELRVAYVGATRARENLYLTRRRTPWGWNLH